MRSWVLVLATVCPTAAAPDPRCAGCHSAQTRQQGRTAMGRALEPAKTAEILVRYPRLNLRDQGKYDYQIMREGEQSIYNVSDGQETIRVPLSWAFGMGAAGQTFLYERDGAWYESR